MTSSVLYLLAAGSSSLTPVKVSPNFCHVTAGLKRGFQVFPVALNTSLHGYSQLVSMQMTYFWSRLKQDLH